MWLLSTVREREPDRAREKKDKVPFLATMNALARNRPYRNCELSLSPFERTPHAATPSERNPRVTTRARYSNSALPDFWLSLTALYTAKLSQIRRGV